ncbi:MAG: hypothetical protein KIT83_18225, partial [Bryobacterales bacterium]|nr:hypothetical protein [Bryobacterales bacterium]
MRTANTHFALRRLVVSAAALACLAFPDGLFALDPTFAMSQYAKKHWQVEQGLPQNYVTSLAQEPGGLLVVGTSGGVARFDGLKFYPVVLDEATGISREWINALAVMPDGSLWISSRDAGTYLQVNGKVQVLGIRSGQPSSAVVRRDGRLIAAGNGTWELREGSMHRLGVEGGGDLSWQGVLELEDGRVLVCDDAGLFEVRDSSVRLLLPTDVTRGRPLSLVRGRSGTLYLGTTTGLFYLEFEPHLRAIACPGMEGPVVSIVEDRDGVVWTATWGKGIHRLYGKLAQRWSQQDGLDDDFVHTLFEDEEGSLWIGSRSGLSRWRSGPIVPYGPREGLDAQFLSSILGDNNGGIWVGTWRRGLHLLQAGRFTQQQTGFPIETSLIRAMAFSTGDGYWISDWFELRHVTSRGSKRYTTQDLGFNASIHAILSDRGGGLWLSADSGLFRYPDASISGPRQQFLANRGIRHLLEDRNGTVWAGSTTGLARIEGE